MADKLMYTTTGQELELVPVPIQSRTYRPISHAQLIDLSRESIQKSGFSIQGEQYTMAREGKQANGRYAIKGDDTEMQIMIGWQNSYDKSLSLKFAIGARIFICSNGAISGDMGAFKKKHMGDVQEFTPNKIMGYISDAEQIFYNLQQDRNRFKQIGISARVRAELLGRMFIEEEIITSTQLGIIKKEIDNPSYNYGAGDSVWQLYNHSTLSLRDEHPSKYYESHINIHKFFKEQFA